MPATEKTILLNEIETTIQTLSLLLSTIQSDHSRKAETISQYRKQFIEMLKAAAKEGA